MICNSSNGPEPNFSLRKHSGFDHPSNRYNARFDGLAHAGNLDNRRNCGNNDDIRFDDLP
jgi:hypothetical protein